MYIKVFIINTKTDMSKNNEANSKYTYKHWKVLKKWENRDAYIHNTFMSFSRTTDRPTYQIDDIFDVH